MNHTCLLPPAALWLVLISCCTEGRRLIWPGGLVKYWGGLPAQRRSLILVFVAAAANWTRNRRVVSPVPNDHRAQLHVFALGKTTLEALHIPVDKLCRLRGAGSSGYWSCSSGLSSLPWSHTTQAVYVCQSLAIVCPFWSSTEKSCRCQKDSG